MPTSVRTQTTIIDGRSLRAERTRLKIVSGYLLLVRHNGREPSMLQVAETAGCSLRSVYERIVNIHGLRLAALDQTIDIARRSTGPQLHGLSRRRRLQAIVRHRVKEYEQWGPLWHFMSVQSDLPDIRIRLVKIYDEFMQWYLDGLFGEVLSEGSEAERTAKLQFLCAATSLENWQHLRYFRGLTFEEVCEQWFAYIDHVLESGRWGGNGVEAQRA